MAQCDVHRVVAAEAAAEREQARIAIFLADEGQHFAKKIGLIVHVAGDAAARRNLAVIPALAIYRIHAKKLDLSGVDPGGESGDHAAIFKLEKAAAGGGKNQDRQAGVAKDEQFHGAAEAAGLVFVIFPVHALRPADST